MSPDPRRDKNAQSFGCRDDKSRQATVEANPVNTAFLGAVVNTTAQAGVDWIHPFRMIDATGNR
jgi:hypothetical protein